MLCCELRCLEAAVGWEPLGGGYEKIKPTESFGGWQGWEGQHIAAEPSP